jgi:glycosyltransferase involved in cell wall biosynthesis
LSLISVIIPIYNAESQLSQCLESVLGQSETSLEVILVNDGSTDGSLAICQRYASKDKRIRLIDQTRGGSIAARRRGLESASAPYITFVDADDWLAPMMLEKLMRTARRHDADITVCNTYKVLGSSALFKRMNKSSYFREAETLYRGETIRSELVISFLHGHSFPAFLHGKLYRRQIAASGGIHLDKLRFFGDDLYYNLEMFLRARSVAVISQPLYYYRAGGLTSRYMPELLQDAVAGYQIQQSIIEQYFAINERDQHCVGSNLMLLNTLRTYLRKMFEGGLSREERLASIKEMCRHPEVIDCVNHEPTARLCRIDFVEAVRRLDYDFLEKEGRRQYIRSWLRSRTIFVASVVGSIKPFSNFSKKKEKVTS